jgi:DNA segregation ATPase FtsK/SpoIIIE-like protein
MTHTKDEALKLAQEALELAQKGTLGWTVFIPDAITAIKQALAAPDTQRHNDYMAGFNEGYDRAEKNARDTTPSAAPVPLTDDPLQGAVDWFLQADGEYFCTATVQRTLRIGYNRAKRLCDTAKERAAHGITKGQR